jgi:hypothetical protein
MSATDRREVADGRSAIMAVLLQSSGRVLILAAGARSSPDSKHGIGRSVDLVPASPDA